MSQREPPCPVKGCGRMKAADWALVCPFHWRQVMPTTKGRLHTLNKDKSADGTRNHRAFGFKIIADLEKDEREDSPCRNSFG